MDLSLKNLAPGEMISISAGLLAAHGIGSVKQTKGLVDDLQAAHDALVAAKPAASSAPDADTSALSAAEKAIDVRHDHAARAFHYLGLAAVEYALSQDPPDEDAASAIEAAHEALLPLGLGATLPAHTVEAGNAVIAQKVLDTTPAFSATLSAMAIARKVTGLDVFQNYATLAAEVGAAAQATRGARHDAAAATPPATLLTARNAWINVVQTVAAALAQAKGDAAAKLLASIVDPAAAATAKKRKGRSGRAPAGGGAGATGATGP